MDKGDSREGVSNLGTACGKVWQRERERESTVLVLFRGVKSDRRPGDHGKWRGRV